MVSAAVAAGILFGIVWNLWHNTIRNCSEKDSMQMPERGYTSLSCGMFSYILFGRGISLCTE